MKEFEGLREGHWVRGREIYSEEERQKVEAGENVVISCPENVPIESLWCVWLVRYL